MPVSAIVTTPGAANANAYCDVAFADQYNLDRPQNGSIIWSSAQADTKSAAILWATVLMDRMWEWEGWVTTATQALLWPRQGMVKPNMWEYVDNMTIPIELKRATAEYARQLLMSDRMADSQIETLGVTSMKAGPVAFSFKDSVYAKAVPDAVYNLIPCQWGYARGRVMPYRETARA